MILNELKLTDRRHGDLRLKKLEINTVPSDTKKLGGNIIAEGEKTGHNHKLVGSVQLYANKVGTDVKYIEVLEDTKLVHQEHDTIPMEKGIYELIHEQEFSPAEEMTQRVID